MNKFSIEGRSRELDVIAMLSVPAVREAVDISTTCSKIMVARGMNRVTMDLVVVSALGSLQMANSIIHKQGQYSLESLKNRVIETLALAQLCYVNVGGLGAIEQGLVELARARRVYPNWPTDLVHQVSIMVEEAGEAFDADLNPNKSLDDVLGELVHTIAMCLRVLENLNVEKAA